MRTTVHLKKIFAREQCPFALICGLSKLYNKPNCCCTQCSWLLPLPPFTNYTALQIWNDQC